TAIERRRKRRSVRIGAPIAFWPAIVSWPAVGRSANASSRNSVLLPLPDGPITAVTEPAANDASTPRRACTSPLSTRYTCTSPLQSTATSVRATEHLRNGQATRRAQLDEVAEDRDTDDQCSGRTDGCP